MKKFLAIFVLCFAVFAAKAQVTIILEAHDVWEDGSGYQLLLDADANTFGTIIPETGPLTSSGDADAATYAEFEYKVPVNADGALSTTNMVYDGIEQITIPAGTYDFCVTNPTPGDRMWIAGGDNGRQDDYVFQDGYTYHFTVAREGSGDGVTIEVSCDAAPNAPTDFTAVPDPNYGLSVELSWTNPTTTLGGTALTAINSIELYRGTTLVNSFANPTPGASITYIDNTIPQQGVYTYRVYAVTQVNGFEASATAYVGHVCPITLTMEDSWGDGWNGAAIEIYSSDNTLVGSYTLDNGTSAEEEIPLVVGTYTFNWVAGSYDSECSFSITDSYGLPIYEGSSMSAGTFLTYEQTCEAPEFYTVSGMVTSSVNNAPIANAQVVVSGHFGGVVTTDATGFYSKDSVISTFPYSIAVTADGFNGAAASFNHISGDTTINFSLTAPTLNVTYNAPIEVTTTQGLNAQYSPITVSNEGNGELTWGTGVEFVRGTRNTNEPMHYAIAQMPRVKEGAQANFRTEVSAAAAQTMNPSAEYSPMVSTISNSSRAAWDLLSSFATGAAGEQGIATDGNFIYTSFWNAAGQFGKYDLEGNFIETFTISGVNGIRDLTYDGTYFYGGAGSTTLYQLDLANQTLVSTISAQVNIRHCSYDPQNDGFWVGDYTDLYLIDRSGSTLVTGPSNISSAYGSAYDNYSAGGPYLWLFTQNSCLFVQYDINANTLTNTTVDITTIDANVTTDAIAGGAFATDALVSGKFVIMTNSQQQPNQVSVFELADAGWLSVTPGSGNVAAGQSTDITLNFNGDNPVGDYYANLTITSRNPFVGDTVIPVVFHIVVPDCDAPTNLQVVPTDYTYMALTWDAPGDMADFVEYRIYRNGNTNNYFATTNTSYNDTVTPGTYCYFVKAYFSDGTNQCLSLASDTVCEEMLHAPSINVTPETMNFITPAGNASGAQTAAVLAYTLESDIAVTTNAPFEISTDGATYSTTATITVTGNETNATLYVRLGASAAVGTYNDNVVLTSDGLTATIVLNGEAIDCGQAATLPFVEDFEGGVFPPECWRLNSTNSITWTSNVNQNDNSTWAYCNYADDFQDEQLITKTIDLSGSVQPMLTFEFEASNTYITSTDPDEQYNLVIYISTDGGNTFASTPLYDMRNDQNNFSDWSITTSNAIDLTPYAAENNVQIMFQYIGTYGAEMWIDNVTIEDHNGITEESTENTVRVFPNPATNMINVEAQGFETYQLVNMLGQTVASNNLVNGTAHINVSKLTNGVYFVRLINGTSVETVKIVKK
ncbi:MAG: DUF2436 domain-containing protein [Bacteroidales bacterium]|nr:DUF2436 domain-containing protein [Bacteroidales bacterium]